MESIKVQPNDVLKTLEKHLLVDGFHIVLDLEKSEGCYMVDARDGKRYIDFYAFFASLPLGFNHPKMKDPEFVERLKIASIHKVANSDIYTTYMAEFVETFAKIGAHPELPNYFFIDGGALAVENALKAAFDWKVRKNFQKGYKEEKGHKVIHFKEAFHGRTGYTMSLTNTDPTKVKYFPKFDWPRITNPKIEFPLTEENLTKVIEKENQAIDEIYKAIKENKDDIACLIIEPIQGEGGDNHFRPEFLRKLREITEENDILYIVDEVQTGVAATGKMWCFEHFGFVPDIVSFGKKLQVCGIMVSDKVNEVDSVFKVSSRLNSTWGANIVDMVRAQRILEIIHEENLIENAANMGDYLLSKLHELQEVSKVKLSNIRGRGLFAAIELESPEIRDDVFNKCFDKGLAVLKSGEKSIRFRPALTVTKEVIDEGINILAEVLKA
ncbi:L-lysine 6-transaminase [Thermotomaculum hydrothermale]|uniref:L-lysine-epsilon aminotransferase n=1 Tax=Thermotomaculum hydrothermale TaxID=981385 RepID=A0A7R6PQM4_9BACT|nr:L-lysine 6-transaminase [Thermotomaculum hydrothermale]BBB32561.1 L-lysine 6-transaminase [Thermotomaculum hydrothermale]